MNPRSFLAALSLSALAVSAHAQSLQDYLKVRKQYGIVQSVGIAALETVYGTRVFEVQGTVTGSLRVGDKASLMLVKTDGKTIIVEADSVPGWLVGNDVAARLIIKATRNSENGPILSTLLAAATEDDIRPIEAQAVLTAAKTATSKRNKAPLASRGGKSSRYTPNLKAPQQAWILPADEATPYYAAYVKKHNAKLSNAEAYRIAEGVIGFSKKYGVDAMLIMAMIVCESDFNPKEVSHAGAMGLGQLMPETVQDYGITNPFDSVQNLYGTVREIREHIDKYRNQTDDPFQVLVLSLAGYNAGDGAVKRHGGVPPYRETQNYVKKVIKLYYHLRGYQ